MRKTILKFCFVTRELKHARFLRRGRKLEEDISRARSPFLEAPDNYRARQAVLFSISDGSFKSFENYTIQLSPKETKWTSLEVRTHPTFLETLISKYDFGPVKLPGLSGNGPQDRKSSYCIPDFYTTNL